MTSSRYADLDLGGSRGNGDVGFHVTRGGCRGVVDQAAAAAGGPGGREDRGGREGRG